MKSILRTLILVIALAACCCRAYAQQNHGADNQQVRVAFWNVENFFDTERDTLHEDGEFCPQGEKHWTRKRFEEKRAHIYKTLAAMEFPTVVGMAEVENDYVLRELCLNTPLRRMRYKYVHYESPDRRGIDNALLYRSDRFEVTGSAAVSMSDSSADFYTRDLLLVQGKTSDGDTLILLVLHLPSKRGGVEADKHRARIVHRISYIMDSLRTQHPCAGIVAMGDFNADPNDATIRKGLSAGEGFINLMTRNPEGLGSYKYQGYWSFIDQIVISSNLDNAKQLPRLCVDGCAKAFSRPFLLCEDKGHMGVVPFRTYWGPRYRGGFSDHLPVYIDLTPCATSIR